MNADLNKDPSIHSLLVRLRADLGDDAFDIVDHWDDDVVAIGLAATDDHRILAYVSTLNHAPDTYSYELEIPPQDGDELYSVAGKSDSCTYLELLDVLCSHWNIVR